MSGLLEALPLWLGVVPFGFVYAAVGRRAGLSGWEVQLMSLLVYAGGAQFAVVRLVAQGVPRHLLIVAAALINLRHVLYGLSLAPYLSRVPPGLRAVAAFFLVDESYGLAMRAFHEARGSAAYLVGAGGSLYLAWNLGTVLGTAFHGSAARSEDPRVGLGVPAHFCGVAGAAATAAGEPVGRAHCVSGEPGCRARVAERRRICRSDDARHAGGAAGA